MVKDDFGRIVIFAGAGASKAIRSDKFPTTKEFFQGLPSELKNNSYFQVVLQFLKKESDTLEVDIEKVLWALQSLFNFFKSASGASDISGFLLSHGVFNRAFPHVQVGSFIAAANDMQAQLGALIGKINEVVYELYSYEPSEDELKDNWIELLSKLGSGPIDVRGVL